MGEKADAPKHGKQTRHLAKENGHRALLHDARSIPGKRRAARPAP